jgi:hypothetical protein
MYNDNTHHAIQELFVLENQELTSAASMNSSLGPVGMDIVAMLLIEIQNYICVWAIVFGFMQFVVNVCN